MTDAITLGQQAAAANKALAAADLIILQKGLGVVTTPTSTVAECAAAMQSMAATLGDPDRVAAVIGLSDGWSALVGGLQTEISKANALAGN